MCLTLPGATGTDDGGDLVVHLPAAHAIIQGAGVKPRQRIGVKTSFREKRTPSLICCLIEAGICTLSLQF